MFVEVFKAEGKDPWYVHLKARNGRVITVSEGYSTKSAATRAARKFFPAVELRVLDDEQET